MSDWDDPQTMLARAQTAKADGDNDMAYQLFARASEITPQDAQAWQGRAETTASPDEALVSYGYATALLPDDANLKRTLDAALTRRVESAQHDDSPALVAIGQEFAEVGLMRDAKRVLQRAYELDPGSADALIWLAGTSGDAAAGLGYLERAAKQNENDPRVQAGIAVLTAQTLPMTSAAAPPPATTLDTADAHVRALIDQGEQQLQSGNRFRADGLFVQATELAPFLVKGWLRRAETTDDEQEMLLCYDQVLSLDPTNTEVRDARTMLLVRQKGAAPKVVPPPKPAAPPATSTEANMRRILMLLVILVVVFAVLGVLLLFLQSR